MNDRIRELYIDHALNQAESGVLDHALTSAIEDGMTVDEAMVHVLRGAGKLPAAAAEGPTTGLRDRRPA